MNDAAIEAATKVIADHIKALNARDEAGLLRTLHFPHHRLSGTVLKTWETGADYFADFKARAGVEWSHSAGVVNKVLGGSEAKVHLDVGITRYRADGSVIKSFHSLWIISERNGHWAAAFRSSFAGD